MAGPNRRPARILLPPLCLALAACQPGAANGPASPGTAATPPAATTTPVPATAAASHCESQDFDAFLRDFADNVDRQRTAIVLPLRSESIDLGAEPEPKPVIRMLTLSDLAFPLMPDTRSQQRDHLQERRTTPDPSTVEITLARPDTDDQKAYIFTRDRCWKLSGIRDDSL